MAYRGPRLAFSTSEQADNRGEILAAVPLPLPDLPPILVPPVTVATPAPTVADALQSAPSRSTRGRSRENGEEVKTEPRSAKLVCVSCGEWFMPGRVAGAGVDTCPPGTMFVPSRGKNKDQERPCDQHLRCGRCVDRTALVYPGLDWAAIPNRRAIHEQMLEEMLA